MAQESSTRHARAGKRDYTSLSLVTAVAALFVAGVLAVSMLVAWNASIRQLEDVRSARLDLQRLFMLLNDAHRGERGFLLTGDERHLAPFETARRNIDGQVEAIRSAMRHRTELAAPMAQVEREAKLILAEMGRVIQIRRESGLEASSVEVQRGVKVDLMEDLSTHVANLEATLDQIIQREVSKTRKRGQWTVAAFVLLLGFSVASFFLTARRLRAEIATRRRSEEALQMERTSLAERVAERTQDLARSEERLRRVVEAIPNGILLVDTAGRITMVNTQVEHVFGYDRVELLGQPVEMLLPPRLRSKHAAFRNGFIQEPSARPMGAGRDLYGLHRDGTEFPVEVGLVPLEMPAGMMVLATIIDITERKRAERALRESEERLQTVLDQMPVGVSLVEAPSGRLLYYNTEAIHLLRHPMQTAEDIGGMATYGAIHPDGTPYTETEYPITRAVMGEVVLQEEMLYRRGDGTLTTFQVSAAPVRDADGNVVLAVSAFEDVSARKQAEAELRVAKEEAEEANRMKSVFLANMSHEIRTPLTTILGFAEILVGEVTGKPQRHAERIVQSGKRLAETLASVLTLARLEAGRDEMDLRELDVSVEVDEVAALYRTEARKKGLTLSVDVHPNAHGARALLDAGGFTSVLQNLIGNAIKFTQTGGIVVSVERSSDGKVLVHVTDTGIGISPEFLPHLFDSFSQESTGLARHYEGSGLGLSIAKQLAEKMGGTISVESVKGEGSRFTISFPLSAAPPENGTEAVPSEPSSEDLSHKRLLVVEDNEDTRLLMESLLESMCTVEVKARAVEAVARARTAAEVEERPFDAILADINLGTGPSGYEVLRELRTVPAYREVPIAAVTAYALPGDREKLLAEGFDAYLGKPFTAEELISLVEHLLAERRNGVS